jgi:hypothetical protein
MCLRRAPEKYIVGAALDRAALGCQFIAGGDYSVKRTDKTHYTKRTRTTDNNGSESIRDSSPFPVN